MQAIFQEEVQQDILVLLYSCIWQLGCWVAIISWSVDVPLMLCPSTNALVFISLTSEELQAE